MFVCVCVSIYACMGYCWMLVLILNPSFLFFSAKLARLKQAKEEAEKEIAEFRAQIEREFQRKVAEVSVTTKEEKLIIKTQLHESNIR
jgi:hypothetical protein